MLDKQPKGLRHVGCGIDLVAIHLEPHIENQSDLRLIVYDQDLRRTLVSNLEQCHRRDCYLTPPTWHTVYHIRLADGNVPEHPENKVETPLRRADPVVPFNAIVSKYTQFGPRFYTQPIHYASFGYSACTLPTSGPHYIYQERLYKHIRKR